MKTALRYRKVLPAVLAAQLAIATPLVLADNPPPANQAPAPAPVGNFGDVLQQIVNAINDARVQIVSTLNSVYAQYAALENQRLQEKDPYAPIAIAANQTKTTAKPLQAVVAKNNQFLPFTWYQNGLVNNGQPYQQVGNIDNLYLNLATMTNPEMYTDVLGTLCADDFDAMLGNDSKIGDKSGPRHGNLRCKKDVKYGIGLFNSSSLLEPKTYATPKENDNAKNFILYLLAANPYLFMSQPTYAALAKNNQLTDGTVNQYRSAMRQYMAYQTIGTQAMLAPYADRLPQPGLAAIVNALPAYSGAASLKGEISLHEFNHIMATHRTADPNWYNFISTAQEPTVLRTIAYELAEIEMQLDTANATREKELTLAAASEILLSETLQMGLGQLLKSVMVDIEGPTAASQSDKASAVTGGDDSDGGSDSSSDDLSDLGD